MNKLNYFEFERKAKNKGHYPKQFQEKFDSKLKTYQPDWNTSLANQIHDLPDFKQVIRELNKHFRKMA